MSLLVYVCITRTLAKFYEKDSEYTMQYTVLVVKINSSFSTSVRINRLGPTITIGLYMLPNHEQSSHVHFIFHMPFHHT